MPNINMKMPDDLYAKVRLAAACGGDRIPKGAMKRFVIQPLRRAVENPLSGAGLRKLKLCAHCFEINRKLATSPKGKTPPLNGSQTRWTVIEGTNEAASMRNKGIFSHLLERESASGP
jgi:hypothetical protein